MIDVKKARMLAIIALIIGFAAYTLAQNAQDTADINNVFEIVVNNTNLAPTVEPSIPGTGERESGNVYNATYPLQLMVFAHADTVSETAFVEVFINGTVVLPQSGRPLGGAESANRSVSVIIPRGANYSVRFSNYHHYEWREYPILSGKNGTLSVNQTIINTQSSFTANVSGQPFIYNDVNFNSSGNVVLAQDSPNHTITITGVDNSTALNQKVNKTGDVITGTTEINYSGIVVLKIINNQVDNLSATNQAACINIGDNYTSIAYSLCEYGKTNDELNQSSVFNFLASKSLIFRGSASNRFIFYSNGSLKLQNIPVASGSLDALCYDTTNSKLIKYNAGSTSCLVSSLKYKDNVSIIKINVSNYVKLLAPITYNEKLKKRVGFAAEWVESNISQYADRLIFYEPDNATDPRGINWEGISTLAIKALQEQIVINEQQTALLNTICRNNQTLCQ